MGLDIYLYRYDDKAATDRKQAEYENQSKVHWQFGGRKYDQLTEQERQSAREKDKALAARLGLDEYGSDKRNKHAIELPSAKQSDHLFKVGYFRSSYNEGGIQHRLEEACQTRLEHIFGYSDQYCFQPDWKASKERCEKALAAMRDFSKAVNGCGVTAISQNYFQPTPDVNAVKALEIYRTEIAQKPSTFDSYSNHQGTFYAKEPLNVVAAIPGKDALKQPCVFLIFKQSDGWTWYLTAIEIMIETCDYVLSQPDPEKYWLHWSG